MKRIGLILLVIIIMVGAGVTLGQKITAKPVLCAATNTCNDCYVRVIGRASSVVNADSANVLMTIHGSGADVFTAQENCQSIYQEVLVTAENAGVAAENVHVEKMFSRRYLSNPEEFKAVCYLSIKVSSTEHIAEFVDAINEIIGCQVVEVKSEVAEILTARETVLQNAIQDAQQKANELLRNTENDGNVVAQNITLTQTDTGIELQAVVIMSY